MSLGFGPRRQRQLVNELSRLADVDESLAMAIVRELAASAGTSVVEAAVVAIATMTIADERSPSDAELVIEQVSEDFLLGRLRFPVNGRPLHTSCHPAQALRLIIGILETLRPDFSLYLGGASQLVASRPGTAHLTLVPTLA